MIGTVKQQECGCAGIVVGIDGYQATLLILLDCRDWVPMCCRKVVDSEALSDPPQGALLNLEAVWDRTVREAVIGRAAQGLHRALIYHGACDA